MFRAMKVRHQEVSCRIQALRYRCADKSLARPTVFARVIGALFFLAAEKSGCVKYADFFFLGLDLGFILV
jgi:hypothetical protein